MSSKQLSIFCIAIMGLFAMHIFGMDIGSDTAVERFNDPVIIEDGDRVAGFAALAGGFFLGNREVTATWDSFFPVSGPLEFNRATLILNQDLIMHNVTEIGTLGSVVGNGHIIEFPTNIGCVPNSIPPECTVTLTASIDPVGGDAINSISWRAQSDFLVIAMDGAGTNQIETYGWDGTTLTFADGDNVAKAANAVAWNPVSNAPGDDVIVAGLANSGGGGFANAELVSYTVDTSGNLTRADFISFGGGGSPACLDVEWHPSGDYVAVAQSGNTGAVKLSVYPVDSAGTFGTPVELTFAPNVRTVGWNTDGTYLAVGTDGSGGNDELRIYEFTTGPLALTLNASIGTASNTAINSVAWPQIGSNTDVIAVGLPSGTVRLQVYRHDAGAGTVTLIPTTNTPVGTSVESVHWSNGDCLAAGLQDNAEGTGGELRIFLFKDDDLSLEDDQEISENVFAVRWSPDGTYLAAGDDGLGAEDPTLYIFQTDASLGGVPDVVFSDVQLFFNDDITFRTPITFSGESVINGRGNTITFATTFTATLESNSSLMFKDVIVNGVRGEHLRALDSLSTFSFKNVKFCLADDTLFNNGRFEVLDEFLISGKNKKFTYSSTAQSLIKAGVENTDSSDPCDQKAYCGCMILDHGTTFEYTPDDPTRVLLENEQSKLVMRSATLMATSSMQLTTGILQIDGRSTFSSGLGIIWGDCVEANNLCVELLPAANLDVVAGALIKQNVG